MKISIICPLYNAENYIEDLYFNIKKQKDVSIADIRFILTESSDNTEEKLKKLECNYKKISKTSIIKVNYFKIFGITISL